MDFTLNSLTFHGFLQSCSYGGIGKSLFLKEKETGEQ